MDCSEVFVRIEHIVCAGEQMTARPCCKRGYDVAPQYLCGTVDAPETVLVRNRKCSLPIGTIAAKYVGFGVIDIKHRV